jgi:pimeloyl-ACP methyl ester carboxylesterase
MPSQPNQTLEHFQTTPLPALEEEIRRGQHAEGLRDLFGEDLASEIEQIVNTPPPLVLADERPLVVLLPGVTGSTLLGEQGQVGLIWVSIAALLAGRLPLIMLRPDGETDAGPERIVAGELMAIYYLPMQLHLKHLGGCDVQPFPYDWRRSPAALAEQLRIFLVKLRSDGDQRKVHLVCHSMGGLVARSFCQRFPHEARLLVEQIVMIGTPSYGSCESVRSLTVGSSMLQLARTVNPKNEPTRVARSFPSAYAMLPAPQACYPRDAPLPYPFADGTMDYFAPDSYPFDDISRAQIGLSQRAYAGLTDEPLPVPVQVIAGFGLPTCTGVLKTSDERELPQFDFDTLTSTQGDGTVPLASVTALPEARLFYVPQGKHADLPLYGSVRRAVQALVYGQRPALPDHYEPGAVLEDLEDAPRDEVPTPPLPGSLGAAELDAIAERIRLGQPTPDDLAALARG